MEDVITPQEAGTLAGLFRQRVARSPDKPAYRYYDSLNGLWMDVSWRETAQQIERWERALHREKLQPGDRVALLQAGSGLYIGHVLARPDPARVEQALARIDVRIHQDIVLTHPMLIEPKELVYVLPALTGRALWRPQLLRWMPALATAGLDTEARAIFFADS